MGKKHVLPITVIGILSIAACIGVVLGILALIFVPMKLHPAYRMGIELAKNDPAVVEFFGAPIKDGFFVMGKTQGFLYGGDVASLESSISGPRAHGRIFIYAQETEDGAWSIQSITIRVDRKIVLKYSGFEPEKGFQP